MHPGRPQVSSGEAQGLDDGDVETLDGALLEERLLEELHRGTGHAVPAGHDDVQAARHLASRLRERKSVGTSTLTGSPKSSAAVLMGTRATTASSPRG